MDNDPTIGAEQVPRVDDWRNGVSTTVAEAGAATNIPSKRYQKSKASVSKRL